MKFSRIIVAFSALLVALSFALAQAPKRGTSRQPSAKPAATPAPTPAAQPTPAAAQITATTVAVINGEAISASDIEPGASDIISRDPDAYLRDFYADSAKAIRDARQRAVDSRVSSMLIAAEAKKRGKTSDEIVANEITAKVAAPTDQEIKQTYDANRDQLGGASLESVRTELINYIRNQRSQELYAAFVSRLKMTNVVTKSADVNAPNLAAGTVLVAVNGEPLRVDPVNERMKAYVYKLEMRIYQARQTVLDRRINDALIIAEANKRKVGPEEIVRTEITDKLKTPTEAEVAKFYEDNKARIRSDLAGARTAIVTFLQEEQQAKLEDALAEKLRAGAKVQILLRPPDAPVMTVALANGASRGDVNAAVRVIEFTDFQCSACGGMYPIVEDVLKSYGNRLHFVMRNFPLQSVHANAYKAAQAAEAAKAQGKYWEYIDLLFKNQTSLEVDSLKKFASQVGLDRKRFDEEFDSGKYESVVRRDMEDGDALGIDSTPTFYINGVLLTEFSEAGLRAAIERAFAKAGKKP